MGCQDFDFNDATGCEDPQTAAAFNDYLDLTVQALNKNKERYKKAAIVKNLDLTSIVPSGLPGIPFVINGVTAFLTAVDRDAILVRTGLDAQPVDFDAGVCKNPSIDGCNYDTVAFAVTPLGPINVERSFVAVDLSLRGIQYRIFNTHLEVKGEDLGDPLLTAFQAAQASELIDVIESTTLDKTVLLMGDINSSPVQQNPSSLIITPYNQFIEANLLDIWELKRGDASGFTCCQDEALDNRKSALYERIDMVFALQEPVKIKNIRLIGDDPSSKTRPGRNGLWFSDHAAVAAKMVF